VKLGVYVHFPWCHARCPYCDFAIAVAPRGDIPHRAYADAILEELEARAPLFESHELTSIYFGGGTPSMWEPGELGRVRAAVAARFAGTVTEVTVEANPDDCTRDRLAALRDAGVDRLSIGSQSFADEELVALGREHDARVAAAAFVQARAAGFANLSLDLIFGLPGRGAAPLTATLDAAMALAPEHLSVYQLTIEPRTSFGEAARRKTLVPAPDEELAGLFELTGARLTAGGYQHYEVSSYARPGRRAVHNSLYWQGAPYLGLGNGAHSFATDGQTGRRFSAHRSVKRYLAGSVDVDLRKDGRIAEISEQNAADVRADRLWLGMRTSDGVVRADLPEAALPGLLATGLVAEDGERIVPTARGLLFADEIGARLLAEV
jgi:putative oxygen-independent coproporphyrinogen III oxidase